LVIPSDGIEPHASQDFDPLLSAPPMRRGSIIRRHRAAFWLARTSRSHERESKLKHWPAGTVVRSGPWRSNSDMANDALTQALDERLDGIQALWILAKEMAINQ